MSERRSEGLPTWLTILVVLTMLALFVYVVLRFGLAAVPLCTIIAGILGGYAGLDELAKRRQREDPS